jgi:hypothetical protein
MVAVVVACLLPPVAFSGEAIRITCADGGGDLVEGNGHSVFSAGLCDVDHTCDGYCTFAFDPYCPICLSQFSGAFTCSPDAHEEACPGLPVFPCASDLPHVVLTLGQKRQAHMRMHVRIKQRHFTLLLRCEYPGSCTSPLYQPPLPQNVPDLTGDWQIQETAADTDCSSIVVHRLKTPPTVRLVQTGLAVFACGLGMQGSVLDSTLNLGTPPTDFDGIDAYTERVSGALPTDGGPITVTESWSLTRVEPPAGLTICTRTATASMSRLPALPCHNDAECIAADACTRCSNVRLCTRSPFCQ